MVVTVSVLTWQLHTDSLVVTLGEGEELPDWDVKIVGRVGGEWEQRVWRQWRPKGVTLFTQQSPPMWDKHGSKTDGHVYEIIISGEDCHNFWLRPCTSQRLIYCSEFSTSPSNVESTRDIVSLMAASSWRTGPTIGWQDRYTTYLMSQRLIRTFTTDIKLHRSRHQRR